MSQHRTRRSDVGTIPASRWIPTIGVTELKQTFEDIFPTEKFRMEESDTVPLRGAW